MKFLVRRKKTKISRDDARVITRLHIPDNNERVYKIINRVLNLNKSYSKVLLNELLADYSNRHNDIEKRLLSHFNEVKDYIPKNYIINETQKLLIGAFFTMEYAIESAALFNPSIVLSPDQENIPEGSVRFIMSLRATGEGHISSIVFRSGIIDKNNSVIFNSPGEFVETPEIQVDPVYNRHLFNLKLNELNACNETTKLVLNKMPEEFTYSNLKVRISKLNEDPRNNINHETIELIHWLVNSNYNIKFNAECRLSERVIFPVSENEISGIEDARFVKFFDDDGAVTFYATYTAFNGINILPQLIETKDFVSFDIRTLNGNAAYNKGMALFPRKIKGKYVMLSRQDGENNYIMFSDHLHFWQEADIIQEPEYPWEFIQIGNCGSPFETNSGWLVLTHGVGAFRQYSIGAILLDLENPRKIIGRLKHPILKTHESEREGYVPNVVYSCGALIHNGELIIPYAMSDIRSGIATANVNELIKEMKQY